MKLLTGDLSFAYIVDIQVTIPALGDSTYGGPISKPIVNGTKGTLLSRVKFHLSYLLIFQWIFQVPVKGGRDYITP